MKYPGKDNPQRWEASLVWGAEGRGDGHPLQMVVVFLSETVMVMGSCKCANC